MRYLQPRQISKIIPKHYEAHRDKSFYTDLVTFSLSGPIVAMVWEGDIKVARSMVGATLPWEALPGSIRGDYACTLPQNLVHCSDCIESATREVELWEVLFE
jgi:nucleoside-diphosphate kinase